MSLSKPNATPFPQCSFEVFRDTEDFLSHIDPKKYDPPFMTTIFNVMRRDAYESIQKDCEGFDPSGQKEVTRLFIEKFEVDYVETLRSKLRERYIDHILQKKYEIPDDVNMKEIEGYGAVTQIAQLAIAIAEWTLELEINAYTLEGLKMYGLLKDDNKEHQDYLSILKNEYNYKKESSFFSGVEYVFRKALAFSCGRLANIAFARGMTNGGLQGKDLMEIVLNIATAGSVPWKTIHNSMNLTMVIGGYLCSHFVEKMSDYANRRDALGHMTTVQETFEANKLHLMTERRTLLDLMEKTVNEVDDVKHEWELDVLKKTVDNILCPKAKESGKVKECEMTEIHREESRNFKVKEEEDCVVVEENKLYQENVDESGVIIVDW